MLAEGRKQFFVEMPHQFYSQVEQEESTTWIKVEAFGNPNAAAVAKDTAAAAGVDEADISFESTATTTTVASLGDADSTLHKCPAGAVCALECTSSNCSIGERVESIRLLPGYWRSTNATLDVKPCKDNAGGSFELAATDSVCEGGASTDVFGSSVCRTGNSGPFCAVCSEGFVSQGGQCVLCSEIEVMPLAQVILIFLGLVTGCAVVLVIAWQFRRSRQASRWRRMLRALQKGKGQRMPRMMFQQTGRSEMQIQTLLDALLVVHTKQLTAPSVHWQEFGSETRRATIVAMAGRRKTIMNIVNGLSLDQSLAITTFAQAFDKQSSANTPSELRVECDVVWSEIVEATGSEARTNEIVAACDDGGALVLEVISSYHGETGGKKSNGSMVEKFKIAVSFVQ